MKKMITILSLIFLNIRAEGIQMNELKIDEAKTIALNSLSIKNQEIVFDDTKTQTHPFGFIFFMTSKKYLQTQSQKDLIPGIGVVIVEHSNKKATPLSSSLPPEQAIKIFIENLNKNKK